MVHIRVDAGGTLTLLEPDNFKRFHIEVADRNLSCDALVAALAPIAAPDGADFWIDAAGLKALSGREADPRWLEGFEAMLGAAKRFGWVSPDGLRIRCHVK